MWRRPHDTVIVALFACWSVGVAAGQPCLAERRLVADAIEGALVAAADLDGDTHTDIAFAATNGEIAWLRSDGGSPPRFTRVAIDTVLDTPTSIEIVDLDLDGHADILVATELSARVQWFENDGAAAPSFDCTDLFQGTSNFETVTAGDLDGDGDMDLFIGSTDQDLTTWLENTGSQSPFYVERSLGNATVVDAQVAHMNNDTDLDIVVALGNGKDLYWLDNNGSPTPSFTYRAIASGGGDDRALAGVRAVRPVDFDGDGDTDVLAASTFDGAILLYESDGQGSTPGFVERLVAASPGALRVDAADLDGDGDLDVISVCDQADAIVWHENDGAWPPAFTTHEIWARPGRDPLDAIVATIDGNATVDVVTSIVSDRTVTWFENTLVENADTKQRFDTIGEALAAAQPADTIDASPGAFFAGCLPLLDLETTPAILRSTGDATRRAGTVTRMAPGSALTSKGDVAEISLGGTLSVAGPGAATVSAPRIRLGGPVTLGSSATLIADGDASLVGEAGFIFGPESTLGDGVRSVVAADIDGDGDLDAVSASELDDSIIWYERRTDPVIGLVPRIVSTNSDGVRDIVAGDVNGDSSIDIIAAETGGNEFVWFQNDGGTPPAFTKRFVVPSKLNPLVVHGVDFENDGDLDLLVGTENGAVDLYLNDGNDPPAFTEVIVTNSSADGASGIATGDLDSDGDLDIVLSSAFDDTIQWRENDGDDPPNFTRRDITGSADGASDVVVADVDADGDLDIVAASRLGDLMEYYENDGLPDPTFAPVTVDPNADGATSVFAADIDLDGNLDLLSTSEQINTLAWYRGDGALPPVFERRLITTGAQGVADAMAADMDGDGDPDVLVASPDDDTVQLFENLLRTDLAIVETASALDVTGDLEIVNRSVEVGMLSDLLSAGTITLDRTSRLAGGGAIAASSVASSGVIAPDPSSVLTLDAAYIQQHDNGVTGPIAGTIEIDLGTGADTASLDILQAAALAGALVVRTDDQLSPQALGSPVLLTAASIAGTRFDVALLPNIGTGDFLSVVYTDATPRGGSVDRVTATVSLQVNPLTGDIELDPQATANAPAGVPQGAVVEDLDLDGDPDLVLALPDPTNPTTANGSVVILYNADDGNPANGWEGFGQTLQVFSGVGVDPSSVAVGLVDADAQPDIVVTNKADSTLSVLLVSDPSPTGFAAFSPLPAAIGVAPEDVILDDLDKDGFLDAATANSGDHSITVLWNSGNGIGPLWDFWPQIDPIDLPEDSECPLSIRPGDGDATFRYLATANAGNDSIGLVQLDPTTRIATVLPNLPVGAEPREIIVADLDNDSDDDIATVNFVGNSVSIALNETSGGVLALGATSDLPIDAQTSNPVSITSGDYDDDADTDLAVLADGVVKVLRNDLTAGQLAFTPIPDQAAGADPLLLRSGDLNVDGRDDVVTVSESTGAKSGGAKAPGDSVSTLVAAPPTPACAGDVNSDGTTDVFDLSDLAANFGSGPGATRAQGDLTGDGFVDVFDFAELAADFGCEP